MYVPSHFAADDEQVAAALHAVTTGELVTVTDQGLVATFLPLIHEAPSGGHGVLLGHLARTNDQWRLRPRDEALVIAHVVDAYVSPSWYASKAEHGRVVPTWNYSTAHIYGHLRVHDDVTWVEDVVRRLTDRHEAGRELPWSVDDAPERFVAGHLRAIVGVELEITRVQVKLKQSQNRPDADQDGVRRGLLAQGLEAAATAIGAGDGTTPGRYLG